MEHTDIEKLAIEQYTIGKYEAYKDIRLELLNIQDVVFHMDKNSKDYERLERILKRIARKLEISYPFTL